MKNLATFLFALLITGCSSFQHEVNPEIEYLLLKHLRVGMSKSEVTNIFNTHASNARLQSDECYKLEICALEAVTVQIPIGKETLVCSGGILKLELYFNKSELISYNINRFYMCL